MLKCSLLSSEMVRRLQKFMLYDKVDINCSIKKKTNYFHRIPHSHPNLRFSQKIKALTSSSSLFVLWFWSEERWLVPSRLLASPPKERLQGSSLPLRCVSFRVFFLVRFFLSIENISFDFLSRKIKLLNFSLF